MKREIVCLLFIGGCGTAFGEGSSDISAFTTDGGQKADGSRADDGGVGCVPQTCDDLGWECGSGDNGCKVNLSCRRCAAPSQCNDQEHKCKCEPATCESLGAKCGEQSDGCGGATLQCGSCAAGQTCQKGQCSTAPCTPTKCGAGQCGSLSDGCGGILTCTACQAPETCGGGGVANQCGCSKKSKEDACGARQCGDVDDGCGGKHNCGSCPSGKACDNHTGGCYASNTGCTATDSCSSNSYGCGVFKDSCNTIQSCGETPVYASSAATATSLCGTAIASGYRYPHICPCSEKGTCKAGPYPGPPDSWHCVSAKSNGTTLNGRFCCAEIH